MNEVSISNDRSGTRHHSMVLQILTALATRGKRRRLTNQMGFEYLSNYGCFFVPIADLPFPPHNGHPKRPPETKMQYRPTSEVSKVGN